MNIIAGIGVGALVGAGIALSTPAYADTCGSGAVGRVTVGPNTSCGFGFAVQNAFLSPHSGSQVVATSPETGQTYTMTCTQLLHRVQCTGGNNALVELW